MTANDDVLRIIQILDFRRQPEAIQKKHVQRWFESSDADVVGAGVDAILRNWECIEPSLTRRELGDLLAINFRLSLRKPVENVSHYAYTCHEAARELSAWIVAAQASGDLEAQNCLRFAKDFLTHEYRTADTKQRNCILAGALEHMFEFDGLRELFSDWAEDPLLSDPFSKAEAWSSWAAARRRSLSSVAKRISELMLQNGLESVELRLPAIGTTMPVITWHKGETHELAITGDEAWVRQFEAGQVDVEKAARFAADFRNWTQSASLPQRFDVELRGE